VLCNTTLKYKVCFLN